MLAQFDSHGGTAVSYLHDHYARFIETRRRLTPRLDHRRDSRILDIGAHWLHQSLVYAMDGFEVTALDLPDTLELAQVKELARAHGIQLLPNADLAHPGALAGTPDDSFDIVLFTEVIEHLAFNPVAMWREIYRVLKPGGCIVVTTPNYYALRSRLRQWLRAIQLLGGGIGVEQILSLHTLSHHWKEFSRREIVRYFHLLSPDFTCRNIGYIEKQSASLKLRHGGGILLWIERILPPMRPDLYVEIELTGKASGITLEPRW